MKRDRRFFRQIDWMQRRAPLRAGLLEGLLDPGMRMRRLTAGMLLVIGGMFGILPVLGFWMIPLGLLILAVDLAMLREPVAALTIRLRRAIRSLRRRRRNGTES